jgi:hypothetical protein
MKLKIAVLGLLSCLLLSFSVPLRAQTNADTTPGGFLSSVQNYFTTMDTNSTTFVNRNFDLWTGAEYVQGVNTASSLGLEYKISGSFSFESVTRNAGIAGIILSQQGGFGYSLTRYDTKLTGYIDGGYDFNGKRPYAEVGARIKKAATKNTYFGIGISTRYPGGRTPSVGLFTGFTF